MPDAYANWPVNALVVATTAATVALVVLLHYQSLVWLNGRLARQASHQQHRKVLTGMYVLLAVHIAEIWAFGLVMRVLLAVPGVGHLVGAEGGTLFDAVYLSATSYTTIGFGDLAPVGTIRFLIGTEALTGFMLITWSASFMYLEMEKFWRK